MAITTPVSDSIEKQPAPPPVTPQTPPEAPQADITPSILPTNAGTIPADNMQGYQAIGANAAGANITGDALVEDRLAKLFDQQNESPLMKAARLRAGQQAGAIGLGNSTQAIQAGQQAVILAGLDIVRPDAATYAQSALQQQQAQNQGALQEQQAAQAYQDATQKSNLTAALNLQQGQMQSSLAQQQANITTNLKAFEAAIAGASEQQKAQIINQQKEIEMRFNEAIQAMNLNAETSRNVSSMFATASASLASNIQSIQTNPDLDADAKAAAIQAMQDTFYKDMQTMANIAGVTLTFH